tara:strand:- start:9 stop:1229 length:1221 start_codon:yes stop_codon:yes gene_type:complete
MKILDKLKNNKLIKSIEVSKLNKYLKKYVPIILSSLLLMSKKESPKMIAATTIASLIGFLYMKNNKKLNNNDSIDDNDSLNSDENINLNKLLRKNKNSNLPQKDYKNMSDEEILFNAEKELNNSSFLPEDKIKNIIKEVNRVDANEDNLDSIKYIKNGLNLKLKEIKDKNFKRNNKRVDKFNNESAYNCDVKKLNKEYFDSDNSDFHLKINELNKNIPLFNMRSSKNIDFYYNFHLHNADNNKINNLIMCRDIHQWMSSSSLSNDDLDNTVYPVYLIMKDHKTDYEIMIFEVYKIFVFIDENDNKKAFVSKGNNYKATEEVLQILVELDHVKDLLNGKDYEEYNLSNHDGVTLFLNNILSHFLASESQSGDVISIDVKQYNENKNTFDYFYHTANYDAGNLFTTSI